MFSVQNNSRMIAALAASAVTVATFAKSFAPFYLIGSTAVFVATSALGLGLIAAQLRSVIGQLSRVKDVIAAISALYAVVSLNFLVHSLHQVPITYLIGILIFHALFLLFGFAAALALNAMFIVLLAQAAIYLIVFAQYTLRFGDFMLDGYLRDVFGIGFRPLYIGIHQEIGGQLALGALAAIGLTSGKSRLALIASLPPLLLLLYHLQARTALFALLCALLVLAVGFLWHRSRKLGLATASLIVVLTMTASTLFYEYAVHSEKVQSFPTDAISRTVLEIQHPSPGLRLGIWSRAWHRIASEPDRLVFGRGSGAFPIDEGVGAPDWLLNTAAPKFYPHNTYLEMLYEDGIVGLLIFGVVTLIPLVLAAIHWGWLTHQERAAISMYILTLVSSLVSGSFAYDYSFQFFLAIAIGVIALKRATSIRMDTADRPFNSKAPA